MLLHLTRPEMLDLWRQHRAFDPLRHDASVVRQDGIDIDSLLVAEMEKWYLDLLLTAPTTLLKVADIAASVMLTPADDSGGTVISLPPDIVRVVDVRLSSWVAPARVVTSHAGLPAVPLHHAAVARRQLHPYTRATAAMPVAVFDGSSLRLYPASTASDFPAMLRCVRRVDGEYDFDEAALAGVAPLG